MSSAFWRYNQDKVTKTVLNKSTKVKGLGLLDRTLYKKELDTISFGFGKPWSVNALRLKSDMDLKVLWYVLLKEKLYFQAEEYMLLQRGFPSKKLVKARTFVTMSMNRLSGVMNERITHKNNMMKLLEFFDYKKVQYQEGFKKNFPEMTHIKDPWMSSSEIKKLDYLEKYIEDFKIVNKTKELFEQYNDLDYVYDNLPSWFNPLDPLGLLNEFESKGIVTKLNELILAKKNFIYVMSEVKKSQKLPESILTRIKAPSNSDVDKALSSDNAQEKSIGSTDNPLKASKSKKNKSLDDAKDKRNNDDEYELELLEHEFKALVNSSEYIKLAKSVEYFYNNDGKVFKRESDPKHYKVASQEKSYEAEIIKLLVEDFLPKKALDTFYLKAKNYLEAVRENIHAAFKSKKEQQEIELNSKNLKPDQLKNKLAYLSIRSERNLKLADFEVSKEFNYIEILKNKAHRFIGTEIHSRIVDEGIKKIMIFDYESIKSLDNKTKSEKNDLNLTNVPEDSEPGNIPAVKVSLLTENEKRLAESFKQKINMMSLLSMYVENADQFRAKHKKHLVSEIQKGRSKAASKIVTKELAAVSYQAKQLQQDYQNKLQNSFEENSTNKELENQLEVKLNVVAKMKQEATNTNNQPLVKVLEAKETWDSIKSKNAGNVSEKESSKSDTEAVNNNDKQNNVLLDSDSLIKKTSIYSKLVNREEANLKELHATLKSNVEIAKKNISKVKGKKISPK